MSNELSKENYKLIMSQSKEKRLNKFFSEYKITNREWEIINLIQLGKTNREIAEKLYISIKTVKNILWNIFKKTKVKNRAQLILMVRKFLNEDEIGIEVPKSKTHMPRVSLRAKSIDLKKLIILSNLKKFLPPFWAMVVILAVIFIIWLLIPPMKQSFILSDKHSIAILPFDNLNPQEDQDYFCAGLVDEIINRLTKIKNLRIPPRTSSFLLKNKQLDIKEIGKKLNVGYILEGSFQKMEERIRIIVNLINVRNNKIIWSNKYEGNAHDILTIQNEIAMAVVENLKMKILKEELNNLTKSYTKNFEAHNSYLKGNWFLSQRSADNLKKAIRYFEKAIQMDPNYAMAYLGLANSYLVLPDYSPVPPPIEAYARGKKAITKALEIDNTIAEAHASLAFLYTYEYNWAEAEKEFIEALNYNPSCPTAHHWYALYLMFQGRFNEALKRINFALKLDPLSLIINRNKGVILFYSGRYEESINEFKKTIELDPHFIRTHYFLGRAYLYKSMFEEAMAEFRKEKENIIYWDPILESQIGIAYAKMGQKNKAKFILNNLIEKTETNNTGYTSLATLYFALEEYDKGFECLEKAFNQRESLLFYMKIDPRYDIIRSDPRFKEFMKKLGL